MPAAQQIFFWYFDGTSGGPGPGVYSCPIDSYREFTIPTSPEVTYGGDYLNQPPPTAYSANFMYGWIGPSQHGLCWMLASDTSTPRSASNDLRIVVNDPSVTKANSIYFEYLGALIVEVDVVNALGVVDTHHMGASIDLTIDPNWHAIKIGPASGQNWIKEVRIRRDGSTSFGLAFVINVKTFCSIGPEFAPMNQDPLAIPQEFVPSSVTVSAPATIASTSEYVDNLGAVQSAIYFPQDNDGAADGPRSPLIIDLALQGGGAHGAFTWGVLDRILEEEWLTIDAISGSVPIPDSSAILKSSAACAIISGSAPPPCAATSAYIPASSSAVTWRISISVRTSHSTAIIASAGLSAQA
jgi:hypothetical protein